MVDIKVDMVAAKPYNHSTTQRPNSLRNHKNCKSIRLARPRVRQAKLV
jgi:hypothetical protein